jgi:UDPglucose 6-dehydrogenase
MSHDLYFNPEFLREKTALADFLNPDRQIVGYGREDRREVAKEILRLMPRAPYEAVMPATEAELVKTATNSFLALKLMFANELYDLADALGVDYEVVRGGLAADQRIGGSHMSVMEGGYRGYGGKCLPKDTMGLIDLAEALGSPLELLKTAHRLNAQLKGHELSPIA